MRMFLALAMTVVAALSLPAHVGAQTAKAKDATISAPFDETAYHAKAARVYRRHARDHARLMRIHLLTKAPARENVLGEHTSAIRSSVEASQKHDAMFRPMVMTNADAEKLMALINQCNASALAHWKTLVRDVAAGSANVNAIEQLFAEIEKDLTIAAKADRELLGVLNI